MRGWDVLLVSEGRAAGRMAVGDRGVVRARITQSDVLGVRVSCEVRGADGPGESERRVA
jgi:hypothetical protein